MQRPLVSAGLYESRKFKKKNLCKHGETKTGDAVTDFVKWNSFTFMPKEHTKNLTFRMGHSNNVRSA